MVFVACDNVPAHEPAEPENEDKSQTAAIPASPARSLSDLDRERQPVVPVAKHHDGWKSLEYRIPC